MRQTMFLMILILTWLERVRMMQGTPLLLFAIFTAASPDARVKKEPNAGSGERLRVAA